MRRPAVHANGVELRDDAAPHARRLTSFGFRPRWAPDESQLLFIPDGDLAAIFDRALKLLLAELEKKKVGASERPRAARSANAAARHIPAAVRREVWTRDGGRCAFVGTHGRCGETGFLEFHHVEPYARGGRTVVDNLQLRCRAHNVYEAEQYFGVKLPLLRERRARYSVQTEFSEPNLLGVVVGLREPRVHAPR